MQLLASGVVDFEKDFEIMTAMHNHKVYPPRFTIEVNGQRATAPSVVEVEFTGVNGDLSIEVILPLPIQPPVPVLIEIPMDVPKEIHRQVCLYISTYMLV